MTSPQSKQSIPRNLSNVTNLEDLTITHSAMPCSPKGGSSKTSDKMVSPGRVRTMKEYEETMAELKKENFNLKLRIYFIEERQEQMKGLKDVDQLFNKNVELSCELENLKKDLSDKEELLLQSAKAMEILQSQHKKQLEDVKQQSMRDKEYLDDHIANLQKILREKEQMINQYDDSSAMYAMAYGYNKAEDQAREVEELKNELSNVTLKVVQLEEMLQEERHRFMILESQFEEAQKESATLENSVATLTTEVEKRDARLQQAYVDLERKTDQLNALTLAVNKKEKSKSELVADKEKKISDLEKKIGELEKRLPTSRNCGSPTNPRRSSGDVTSSSKDDKLKNKRSEEKILSKQLQDAQSKLIHLEEQVQNMQTRLQEAQETLDNKDSDIKKLQEENHKALVTIKTLMKKNKVNEKEISLLRSDIDKKEKLIQEMSLPPYRTFPSFDDKCDNNGKNNETLKKQLDMAQDKIAELVEERNTVKNDMEMQIQNLKISVQEKEVRLNELEEKFNSSSPSECKDNKTAELESKLEEMKIKLHDIQRENRYDENDEGDLDSFKDDRLLIELDAKKKEIESLKVELKKRTFNLQELVNKELWDKNREIEKLNKLCERRQVEIVQLKKQLSSKTAEVSYSQEKIKNSGDFNFMMRDVQVMSFNEIKDNFNPSILVTDDKKAQKDYLLQLWEEKKFLVKKVEELEEHLQNMPERDSDSRLVQTLKSDLAKARQEAEQAEKSRKEVVGACSLLTNRLQELADFLESLLPSLGAKKRRVLQQAVDRSRELSKSFSAAADNDNTSWQDLQPSLYVPLLPDFSTVDFWSGDDVTDLTLEEEANEEVDTIAQLRSKIEKLELELKQKDSELSKLNSHCTPNFQSMWSIGTNDLEDIGPENNNFVKLMSMFESLETNDSIDNLLEEKANEENLDSFITGKNNVFLRNELKSSNIGEIIISSKKVLSKDEKNCHNVGSESEAWSEPDRSVSLARIGLIDDTVSQSWVHDDSSDTTDNGEMNSVSKRTKLDLNELRRLQNKIYSLEEANKALRGELSILHKLAPAGICSTEDKSTSIEGFSEDVSIPPNVLDEIRNQREKLESAIFYNDTIRSKLEAIFDSQVQDKELILSKFQENNPSKVSNYCIDLENQCKVLESQCNDLEVAIHTERSLLNQKVEEMSKLEKQLSFTEEDRKIWKEKAESSQNKVEHLEKELNLKCNEIIDTQNSLQEYQNEALKQSQLVESKLKVAETKLKEERDRWLSSEVEILSQMKALQVECNDLREKLKNCEEEKREIVSLLEIFKVEDEKHKKQINELNDLLDECKSKEKNLISLIEEWKLKYLSCHKDAESAKSKLLDAEKKMSEIEKINAELEFRFRSQVEVASRQVSQAEFKIKDLEVKHKTPHLERVKSELERRVAELEAANSELESRLSSLQINKLPSDSENEDQDNVTNFKSTKHIKWPITSPPLSPSRKPTVSHLPLVPCYTSQRSNDVSSDYMSDQDNIQTCSVFWPQRSPVSASPDLGIESDQGRLSSLETNSHPHTVSIRIDDGVSELAKLEEENVYLRQHLVRTRTALEKTLSQLTAANHKKRQVERAICTQLGKTHLILKQARVNLESEEDSGC